MTFYRSNLLAALQLAMKTQREIESKHGYTGDSGLVAGWQEMYDEVIAGESNKLSLKDDY